MVLDAAKCSKLRMEQKRQLVYEVAKWSDCAVHILHAWSRQEILQILCSELGKERKYTGFTKSKITELLLKLVLEKQSQENGNAEVSKDAQASSENSEKTPKRQRVAANGAAITSSSTPSNNDSGTTIYCKNSACKAKMSREDGFCKRCSCCICRRYDDNKDPSLWLSCNSDPPFLGKPCGMSCHLECALRHESSGISKAKEDKVLDGSFCCVSCGKWNDLLGSWRKQIVEARDTRRVDILCYRLSLAQKILSGTKRWQNLCEVVGEAVSKLEEEVGPLTGLPVKKARGIVNRLSSGPQIQKMCGSVVESLDSMLLERVVSAMPSDCKRVASDHVRFEDISSSSVNVVVNSNGSCLENVVSYSLWHRKADETHYSPEPTFGLASPSTKFRFEGLSPETEYFLKVVSHNSDNREMGTFECKFRTERKTRAHLLNLNSSVVENLMVVERSQSPATNCSMLSSNPSSVEDETNNHALPCNVDGNRGDDDNKNLKEATSEDVISLLDDSANNLLKKNKESSNAQMVLDGLEADLQITPRNKIVNGGKNSHRPNGRNELQIIGSSSKKRSTEEEQPSGGTAKEDKDLEYYVKVIRRLECDGHIEASFRQKFLTWYSLRATPREIRIVKAFVGTFFNDPESLAEQLLDTFSEVVSNKGGCDVPSGFCTKLWH